MSELPVYETWLERSGHIETVVTDAPGGMRLVDADDYDKLQAERDRLREALEKMLHPEKAGVVTYEIGVMQDIARTALQEAEDER